MIKRILSVFLTVLLVAGLVMVPGMSVSADEFETIDIADYVPEAKPTGLSYSNFSPDNGILGFDASYKWPNISVLAPDALNESENAAFKSAQDQPALGCTMTYAAGTFASGKTYVMSFSATNTSETVNTKVVSAIVDGSGKIDGKGTVGAHDLAAGETKTIVRTITLKDSDTPTANTKVKVGLGFGNTKYSSNADLALIPNSSIDFKISTFYIAEEAAYDIENTLSSAKTITGSSVTGNAKVVNQVGEKGSLDQTMSYKAVNSEGKDVTDEYFSITAGENGVYTVNVNSNAPQGTYTILAISSKYHLDNTENFFQAPATLEIESGSKFTTDYTPEAKPAGLNYSNFNPDNGILGFDASYEWPNISVLAPDALNESENAAFKSAQDQPALGCTMTYVAGTFASGKTYVMSFSATNTSETVNTKVVSAIVDGSGKIDGKGTVGAHDLAAGETKTIVRTITLKDSDTPTANTKVKVGLGFGNTKYSSNADLALIPNSSIDFKISTFYIAEEKPYDIDVTAPNPVVCAGGTLAVNAAILNQVGMEGVSLNQNFEWVALDSIKENIADGITVTWDELDSSVATVSVDEDVAEGTYVIAAYNAEYDMAKSITITVSNEVSVENIALDSANTKVTFDALNVPNDNFDVKVFIAEYTANGTKLEQAEAIPVTLFEGNNIGAEAVYTKNFNEDNLIKIFVWKSDLTPLAEEIEVKKN